MFLLLAFVGRLRFAVDSFADRRRQHFRIGQRLQEQDDVPDFGVGQLAVALAMPLAGMFEGGMPPRMRQNRSIGRRPPR